MKLGYYIVGVIRAIVGPVASSSALMGLSGALTYKMHGKSVTKKTEQFNE